MSKDDLKGGASALASPPTDMDALPIWVRAYVHPKEQKEVRDRPAPVPPSDATLVVDTETTKDEAQSFCFGTYQWWEGGRLVEAGIFYDPDGPLTPADIQVLQRVAAADGQRLLTRQGFIDEIFYGYAYDLGATIVGFNLPFDISRLAIHHGPARRKMRGGFTFKLTTDKRRPNLQVKHLSQRTSFIRFTAPYRQKDGRGMRKRGLNSVIEQGSFVDVHTMAGALLSDSYSLSRLSKTLKVPHIKEDRDDHGGPLTEDYVRYAIGDPQTTSECYQVLQARYREFGLSAHADKIYSEASLGKAHLAEMNIQPWRKCQRDFPPEILGYIISTYYGGRSEMHIRRMLVQVLYCDFDSMYPTVCALMGLWRFVIADGMTHRDGTEDVRAILETVTLDQLQSPAFWPSLTAIVRLRPNATLMPVRAPYDGDGQATIGLNFLTANQSLWYTLADCIVHKLLTGEAPQIEEAIIFEPGPPQAGLKPIEIHSNKAYCVDPYKDDFYRRLIDLRRSVKAQMKALPEGDPRRDELDIEQGAHKIAANATSYGIFVEVNVNEVEKPQTMICHGPSGVPFEVQTHNVEEPGKYFHPLLATLITGAARLMLAIAERLTIDQGLEWAMCDTDSMAIARPEKMGEKEFEASAAKVCAWFEALNPYEQKGSIFKVEDANYDLDNPNQRKPLWFFGVSAKRYCLANIGPNSDIVLRKASAHGLGHVRAPYDEKNPAQGIPKPEKRVKKLGCDLWQHDWWYQILRAALRGNSAKVDLNYHPALNLPAVSRYAATTPKVLAWFDKRNRNRQYTKQLRPFGFVAALFVKAWSPQAADNENAENEDRRKKTRPVRPVAPFDRDPRKVADTAFDRETGTLVPRQALKTVSQLLAQYHLHPEMKFRNADYADAGVTERRHIIATDVRHIGKEANKWEQQFFTGADDDALIDYGAAPDATEEEALFAEVEEASTTSSRRALAEAASISERHLHGILAKKRRISQGVRIRLRLAIRTLRKQISGGA